MEQTVLFSGLVSAVYSFHKYHNSLNSENAVYSFKSQGSNCQSSSEIYTTAQSTPHWEKQHETSRNNVLDYER